MSMSQNSKRNKDLFKKIKNLLLVLESKHLIQSVHRIFNFPDDPFIFRYASIIGLNDNLPSTFNGVNASGVSFTSSYLALLKCLAESAERSSILSYEDKKITIATLNNINKLKKNLLRFEIPNEARFKNKKLGWIKGTNLTKNKQSFIPAQLIYPIYARNNKEEVSIKSSNGSGAAGGFDKESVLLRGIYELIEHDSFMTIYLNKISAPRIDLKGLRNRTVDLISNKCARYNLELYSYDVTTDINIPSFLALLIDRTGIGPSVSCGLKAGLRSEEALIGSIEESFLTRPWIRREIQGRNFHVSRISKNKINSHLRRGLFWFHPRMLKNIEFFLNQQAKPHKLIAFSGGAKEELAAVKKILSEKGYEILYVDITLPSLKKIGFRVYKVMIPFLQPYYSDEKNKVIESNRLSRVAKFFGESRVHINKIPHPFL